MIQIWEDFLYAIAAREGLVVNGRRTRRLWIELGLKRPARVRKKQRCAPARHQRMRAVSTADKSDCSTSSTSTPVKPWPPHRPGPSPPGPPSKYSTGSSTAWDRFTHIRMDNGPELTAHALADWCRFTGVDPAYIDPGSPWQDGSAVHTDAAVV